uniref:Uncharacterized protein n=1 Tax=Cucumis sativus TaxID=3659 RepID=A0A0A0KUB2_CUCSA
MASNKDSMLFKALFVVILIITSSQYVAFGRLHISDAIPHYRSDHKDDREKEKTISRVEHLSQTDTPRKGNYGGRGEGPTS